MPYTWPPIRRLTLCISLQVDAYQHFFQGVHGGTFVEMGALEGFRFSNTYSFEKVLGWNGVLIEANPESCRALAVNRPKTINLCTALI